MFVLTGDQYEEVENIARACALVRAANKLLAEVDLQDA
jgi:hypothetical protein